MYNKTIFLSLQYDITKVINNQGEESFTED